MAPDNPYKRNDGYVSISPHTAHHNVVVRVRWFHNLELNQVSVNFIWRIIRNPKRLKTSDREIMI